MTRSIKASAKNESNSVKSISVSVTIQTQYLVKDEIAREVRKIQNDVHDLLRKAGFSAGEIKVNT
jgi:hypothetical protein